MQTYNRYHINLILLYYLDSLPTDIKVTIPRSTLSGWRSQDLSKIIGSDLLPGDDILIKKFANNEKMKQAAKALFFISDTIATLLSYAENKAELFRSHMGLVLDTLRRTQPIFGVKRVLRILGLSSSKLYYWLEKKRCENSIFQLCQPRHPNQLLNIEVDIVKNYLLNAEFENWSTLSIYYQAMKDKAVFMGIGTWYKYTRRLGIKRKFFKIKRKHEIGVRASKSLEVLHMDVTIFKPLDHTKVYIYFIIDNFSRAILGWKASAEYSSSIALDVLKGAIKKHAIKIQTTLITDGGPENQGEVSKFVSNETWIEKLIAQKDIIQSNSMVEATNKHMKYYYLFKKNLKDITDIVNCLDEAVSDYNDKPHGRRYGFTPNEILSGVKLTGEVYSSDKVLARKHRISQNKLAICCQN